MATGGGGISMDLGRLSAKLAKLIEPYGVA